MKQISYEEVVAYLAEHAGQDVEIGAYPSEDSGGDRSETLLGLRVKGLLGEPEPISLVVSLKGLSGRAGLRIPLWTRKVPVGSQSST